MTTGTCRKRHSMHTTNGNTFDSAHAHARPLALDVAVNISLDALGAGSAAVLGEASAEAGVPLVEEGGDTGADPGDPGTGGSDGVIYDVDAVHAQYSAELFAGLFITNAPTLSTWLANVSKGSLHYPSRPKHRTVTSVSL